MPPKSKTKKKKPKALIQPEYNLLTMEEMKAKELKYYNRLNDLKKCRSFIDDALLEVRTLNQRQLLKHKWLDFLNCNPLPKPHVPPDIRRFYTKLKYMEKENTTKNLNWLLLIDEKSILSQDIYRQDLTRHQLDVVAREKLGEEYNSYVRDSIKILQSIDNFLDNDMEVAKCPVNILDDIVKRKWVIENNIMDFLNSLTYRIISSENAEMKSIDAISAEYFFKASNFDIHIWCLKNVAIRFSQLGEPRLIADFHSINLLLQIPLSMLKENLVIRALHMNFDLLSEKTKSCKQLIPASTKIHTVGLLDLHDCLANEWTLQMEIQAKTLNKIKQKRLEYEEQMRLYEEQVENNKKQQSDNKKTKKTKTIFKPANEPVAIADDIVPDIYEEFLQEEQTQYESFIDKVYNPELLNLSPHEINLRKYFILGGIYQVHYIEKPKHTDFNSFNMTWHQNESKLVIERNTKISSGSWLSSQSQIQIHRRFTKRMTVFEAETRLNDPNIESPWFIVTLELPEYLCFWGEPIACHFEETIRKVKTFETVEIAQTKEKNMSKDEEEPVAQNELSSNPAAVSSIPLVDIDSQDNISLKRRETVFQDSLANTLLNKRRAQLLPTDSKESLYIKDFSLLQTLTKPQIRHIERHIIPRIISSYKLPKEVQNEELQLFSKKPKGKGRKIINLKSKDLPSKLPDRQFTFSELQNNPERIFAKYPEVETLHILSYMRDLNLIENLKEPETFAELLQIVEDIKKKYQQSKNKISNSIPLERQITTRNKRIKQMLKTKKRLATKPTTISRSAKRSILQPIKFESESLKPEENELEEIEKKSEPPTYLSFEENIMFENTSSVMYDTNKTEQKDEMQTYLHWTTEHILRSQFDRESRKIVLHTDRLGNFGFAFKLYEHFPFKSWSMEPSTNDPNNEVMITLDTQHVKCVLYITANGIRGHVTEATKSYVRNPKMYLVIENPIADFKEFKKLLKANHLNIFAEHDASFYIDNGYYSEKHLSNELHTYNCMSVHSTHMRFNFSLWNRLAKRRDIILKFNHYQDLGENLVEVRITPGEAFFVEIQESCSDDLNVIKLDYNLTWRNIASYSDLHHLIVSVYPNASDLRCKNPKLICFIRDLLSEVRPLSFS